MTAVDLHEIYIFPGSLVAVIFVVLVCILLVMTIPIGAIAFFSKHRGVIRNTNLYFLYLILFGVVLSYRLVGRYIQLIF